MSENEEILRLNKYISKCGISTRKEAVDLIKKGLILVNGTIHKEPFYEVQDNDVITYKGKTIIPEKKYEYILLNKPRDISHSQNAILHKPSIADLIKKKTDKDLSQIFPILDSSSGLTILTNDEDLIAKYIESSKKSKIVFEVQLDKSIDDKTITDIINAPRASSLDLTGMSLLDSKSDRTVGVEMLSGTDKDLIDLFSSFGYKVERADRTFIHGLTKKDLKRGWSRFLSEQELIFLKYF
ncbi:MAG: S4 domain-containing protein [Saprospiraceae bacterium]